MRILRLRSVSFLLVCAGVVSGVHAGQDDGRTLILEENFGAECVGWSMKDWTNPFRPGLRPDHSYVRLEDGLMKIYLGRGMQGMDKSDLYHGKVVSRPLTLYADFVIECVLQWDRKTASTILEAWVCVRSGHKGVAGAGFGTSSVILGDVLGYTRRGGARIPLTGQGKIRFERLNRVVKVFWNDALILQKEATYPITSIEFTAKTYHTRRVEGSYAGLDWLRVYLPKPSLALSAPQDVEASPNLLVGGDFETKAEGAPGADLDKVMLEAEGLAGAGIGSLTGWSTDVDGVQRVWEASDSPLGKSLRLELKKRNGTSFVSRLFSVEPGAEYEFSCLTKIQAPGLNATAWPACTILGCTKAGGSAGILCQPDVARGVNDWNWKESRARFTVRNAKVAAAEITLAVRADGEEGAALFDNVRVRKLTERESQKTQIAALREDLIPLQGSLTRAGGKLDTTLDVLGFDLEAITDAKQRQAFADEIRQFAEQGKAIDGLIRSANDLYWASAEVMQFFDRVAESEIAGVESRTEAFEEQVAAFRTGLHSREQDLRKRLRARRPPRPRRKYKDNFEWARNRFHLYWQNAMGLDPPGFEDAFRYMGEMGTTVLQAGLPGLGRPYGKWESRDAYLQDLLSLADQEQMRIFGCFRPRVSPHPSGRQSIRDTMKQWFEAFGQHGALSGLEFDEIHFGCGWCEECRREFRKYLRQKYSTKELVELGILAEKTEHIALEQMGEEEEPGDALLGLDAVKPAEPVDTKPDGPIYDVNRVYPLEPAERNKNRVLWMEHREFVSHLFEEGCKDAFDYAHSVKKDAIMMPLLSLGPIHNAPFSCSLARLSALGDMIAIDPYWDGIPEEALYCDLMRANAKGPAIITVGTGLPYIRGNTRSLKNDLCICFAHTDGMYVFDWIYVFKQPPHVTDNPEPYWTRWWRGAWEHVWATFRKAHKIEKYLVQTESPANVAMLYSERSASVYDYRQIPVSMGGRYCRQQMGLYCLFMQTRIQEDPIFAEGLTREKLDRYAVLFVQNAAALTPEQEELIRSWVRDGGQLIATASTSIFDRWGRKQEDYRLGDVFGVRYVETTKAAKNATFGEAPEVSYLYGRACDVIEPTTGTVVSKWAGGAPAVVTNSFGKGRCVFISARDLGFCYSGKSRPGGGDRIPVHKKFYPGVREFVSHILLEALKAKGQEPTLFASNCPDEVETVIRVQNIDGKPRRMLHLLNYSFNEPIQGVGVELPGLGDEPLSVFYPVDNQPVRFQRKGDRIAFTVRDFDVHEVIVIEKAAAR